MNKRFWILLLLVCACKKAPVDDSERIRQLLSYQNLGLAYLEENQVQEARNEYNKIIQLAPEEALGYANVAIAELRLGNYAEAENRAKQAIQRSKDPDVSLIRVEIHDRTGNVNQAIEEAESTLQENPQHVRLHYKTAQLYARSGNWKKQEPRLKRVVELMPGNLAAHLEWIQALVRNDERIDAVAQLEEIRKQIPELTPEIANYFETALDSLKAGNTESSLPLVIALTNLLKPTPLYQSSIIDLVGPGGAMIGFPILHYSPAILAKLRSEQIRLASIRFVESTSAASLNQIQNVASIVAGDFDADGRVDLFVAGPGLLFKNLGTKFVDVTRQAGLQSAGASISAHFGDFDNDGKLDLYVVRETKHSLYRNIGNGKFSDVTKDAHISDEDAARALFVELDQDGDLDLLLLKPSGNRAYRNNGDGTFTEFSDQLGIAGSTGKKAVFGDFDEDGDLDLFVSGDRSFLFTNLRQGHFQDVISNLGIRSAGGSGAVVAVDANQDGYLDLWIGGQLFVNKKDGTFYPKKILQVAAVDVACPDFDNDGIRDFVFAGTNQAQLFRGQGNGGYKDVSHLLPSVSSRTLTVTDYDSDGDEDLLVTGTDGRIHLLRNDGGNANYWLNVQPVGLGPGSGKNNRNSIGAKVEVKTGDQYQMAVVTEPVVHFGLGDRKQADVIRIVWTNGVPQNHVLPGSNQTIVEKQVLKGSCAFLYAWNGKEYDFVTDILWKSALGMPLGIMAGEMKYGFPNSTQEFLKIPGAAIQERDGKYFIQITEELWETAFLDQNRLIVLDHPNTVEVYVDEKFVIPPYPDLRIYPVFQKLYPVAARDEKGRNMLPLIREKDDQYVSGFSPDQYQGIARMHDLILDLGKQSRESDIVLFMNCWLFPTDASINVAISQSERTPKVIRPYLQVLDSHGDWQTVIPELGFPQGKNKMMIADLKGKFLTENYKIRIRTNMEISWDQIFFTKNEPSAPYTMTPLKPVVADLHYRGFSEVFRKGLDGPHWFDYSHVSAEPKWRDLVGYYTRYGDVKPLLLEPDDQYVIINSGDELSIQYDASQVPALKHGWTRDFLIYSDGWMKDGDLNTVEGKTVAPLPFHAMTVYPYGPDESFPNDAVHQEYLRNYNTRKVTSEKFRMEMERGRPARQR